MINEEFVTTVLSIISMGLIFILLIYISVTFGIGDYIKKMWNTFIAAATWRPKSGIDKEIEEEEKEIAELERQKEKIDTLANLRRRKERLFSDVHRAEFWECTACGDEFDNHPDYVRHIAKAHRS